MRQRPTPCCNAWGSRGHCNVKYVSSGVKKKTSEDDVCFRFSICFPYSYISENSQRSLFPGLRALIFCLGYMNTTHRGLLPAREFHISPEISPTVKNATHQSGVLGAWTIQGTLVTRVPQRSRPPEGTVPLISSVILQYAGLVRGPRPVGPSYWPHADCAGCALICRGWPGSRRHPNIVLMTRTQKGEGLPREV